MARPVRPPVRRTQAQRREATRQKLLDAAVAQLVEEGYARTTTIAVAQRAGTSQGALFKHFPSKAALLGAAVEQLFPRLIGEYQALVRRAPSDGDRVEAAVAQLWALYQRPELQAALELFVAARTDPELADVLAVVNPPHRASLQRAAHALFPEAAAAVGDAFDGWADLALYAVQGVALECMALPAGPAHRRVFEVLSLLLRTAFAAASAAAAGAPPAPTPPAAPAPGVRARPPRGGSR